MSQTRADAAAMSSAAANFENTNNNLQSMLTKLMGELEGLRSTWVGQGGQAFEQVKLRYQEDQKKLSEALTETASAIRTSGTTYTATDQASSDRVAKSNSGLQLPL